LFNIKLRIFLFFFGNILATNYVFSIKKVKAKSFYPASKQTQGHGFYKTVFLLEQGMRFDM
jgi:hypothetical protein